jgi:hypothetical protein
VNALLDIERAQAAAVDPHATRAVRASAFVHSFVPTDSVIESIPAAARGRLIAITGMTGHAKTTVATAAQVCISTGTRFAGGDVVRGGVAVLCGENPDDYNAHLIATMQDMGLEPHDLDDILVIPSRFDIDGAMEWLRDEVERFGELVAVFVDTSAAFFMGADDNSNVEQHLHASRLRALTELPGKPCVFVLCHPVKNATRENLLPRGGGAFLNEIDANLTVWRDESGVVTLHWAGKMRGAQFEPIRFELKVHEMAGYVDGKGRALRSAVVRHISIDQAEQHERRQLDDENTLILAMQRKPGAAIGDLAMACGWASGGGTPSKSRVHRVLTKLQDQGLTEKDRSGSWRLTGKGKKVVGEL